MERNRACQYALRFSHSDLSILLRKPLLVSVKDVFPQPPDTSDSPTIIFDSICLSVHSQHPKRFNDLVSRVWEEGRKGLSAALLPSSINTCKLHGYKFLRCPSLTSMAFASHLCPRGRLVDVIRRFAPSFPLQAKQPRHTLLHQLSFSINYTPGFWMERRKRGVG